MPHMIPAPGAFAAGSAIFVIVLWDAFESIILPRRVTRKFRLARVFYKFTWRNWKFVTQLIRSRKRREALLSFYGPLSLLVLVGVWAVGLVLAFGLMQFGAGSAVNMNGGQPGFATDIYLSGTTFFTLGLGDVVPQTSLARVLVVTEAGFGFGFLAAVIGYLPFIYGSFSKREVNISLLDARAGTPPTAGELLRRHAYPGGAEALQLLFRDWEYWAAELMESHLSYPVLAFFRSQHDNQSWIAALTAILDSCALVKVAATDTCRRQAELTFAIARHAAVDLSQVFKTQPRVLPYDRLPAEDLKRIANMLAQSGLKSCDAVEIGKRLTELRNMYEPYLFALAEYLSLSLPPWMPGAKGKDNWQTTAWGRSAGLVEKEGAAIGADDHF